MKNTFNLSEVLEKATSGDETRKDITNETFWSEDFSNFDLGKTFSLNNSFEIGKGNDPHYFMCTINPNTIP